MKNTTIVFVHGAWHGAWSWAPVQALLDDAGVASLAVDLPGQGASPLPLVDMYGDARSVVDTLHAIGGSFILVGHSYGGSVISEVAHLVAHSSTVELTHLVYIAAFPLDEGESPMTTIMSFEPAETLMGPAMVAREDGTVTLHPERAADALFNELTPQQSAAAMARVRPFNGLSLTMPVSSSAWRRIPSTYIVCARDQAIHPTHQRQLATRCTFTVELDTDHSPFASMPHETTEILLGLTSAI
jgi:pimeloyl-ACP methyl ester carboxylesterase